MEIPPDRERTHKQVFTAIDIYKSGTRKEERLRPKVLPGNFYLNISGPDADTLFRAIVTWLIL